MRKYDKLMILALGLFMVLVIAVNVAIKYISESNSSDGREYRVWINRISSDISEYEKAEGQPPADVAALKKYFDVSEYKFIEEIKCIKLSNIKNHLDFVNGENKDYVIYATGEYVYKITYSATVKSNITLWINIVSITMLIAVALVLVYIRQSIIKPFNRFEYLPYELSKGNLNMPIQETKGKYFGKFLWGMDLLRENIEENKKRELELQKEKKLLLLSLSHDIKTPLSAIKLYSKALSKNLYKDEAKKAEIIENISVKADEIEGFISQIVRASNDDFITFKVAKDEFYVKDVLKEVEEYYQEKMSLNNIGFGVKCHSNCLLQGDRDRTIEVIQNIIENAIKYGDGKSIEVVANRDEDVYQISIINTGCTLDKRELPHIFDSFFRGTNVEKENGSGLGLYICKKLMNLMEGEITARIEEDADGNKMRVNVLFRV